VNDKNGFRCQTIIAIIITVKILLILSVLIVSSCGMQGDLYLPEEKTDNSSPETESK